MQGTELDLSGTGIILADVLLEPFKLYQVEEKQACYGNQNPRKCYQGFSACLQLWFKGEAVHYERKSGQGIQTKLQVILSRELVNPNSYKN